jgi:hypothetical protein
LGGREGRNFAGKSGHRTKGKAKTKVESLSIRNESDGVKRVTVDGARHGEHRIGVRGAEIAILKFKGVPRGQNPGLPSKPFEWGGDRGEEGATRSAVGNARLLVRNPGLLREGNVERHNTEDGNRKGK